MRRSLLSLALIGPVLLVPLAACSGGGNSNMPPAPPPPPPLPPPPPPPPDFSAVDRAVDAFPVAQMMVLIGDETGVRHSYAKGGFTGDTPVLIGSATKMVTGFTMWRLVDRGEVRLDQHPQDSIAFWTSVEPGGRGAVTLEQTMAFTTGFNQKPFDPTCINDGVSTLAACVQEIHDGGTDSAPGTQFSYGPEHMQIGALMAATTTGTDFISLMDHELFTPFGLSDATRFSPQSGDNPRFSGSLQSTANDYGKLLTAFLDGSLTPNRTALIADRTETVFLAYRPEATRSGMRDWHYAFGFWRECDTGWNAACADDPIISSPGAFGFTPWVDVDRGYWGIIAMEELFIEGVGASERSVDLEQELQPLILDALDL